MRRVTITMHTKTSFILDDFEGEVDLETDSKEWLQAAFDDPYSIIDISAIEYVSYIVTEDDKVTFTLEQKGKDNVK